MLIKEFENGLNNIAKIVVSQPVDKKEKLGKLVFRPFVKGKKLAVQEEYVLDNKAFHKNFDEQEFLAYFNNEVIKKYKQLLIVCDGVDVSYFISPTGKIKRSETSNKVKVEAMPHNREKKYIFKEGEPIPVLVDLGVFTKDYKIVASKYDKFKQINRFIEIVDDQVKKYDKKKITILDFGCGKSYLTFVLYYYFVFKRGIDATIIGYDLKRDVVEDCNKAAKKYGYDKLHFEVKDVSKGIDEQKVDMMVTLHACDTATDYALDYALRNNIQYIFSVPCCQHQINNSIKKGGDLDLLLKDGLIKERTSALLTDAIRVEILRQNGYEVEVLEFVDFAHSPKNIMLRAKKQGNGKLEFADIIKIADKYQFKQELLNLQLKR